MVSVHICFLGLLWFSHCCKLLWVILAHQTVELLKPRFKGFEGLILQPFLRVIRDPEAAAVEHHLHCTSVLLSGHQSEFSGILLWKDAQDLQFMEHVLGGKSWQPREEHPIMATRHSLRLQGRVLVVLLVVLKIC